MAKNRQTAKPTVATAPIHIAPTPTAKPGTPDGTAQKAPKEPRRKPHPTIAALGANERIETIPPDFNFDTNNPIKRKQFKQDWDFFNYQAQVMDYRAAGFRTKAEESQKLGAGAERAKSKRLVALQSKMKELQEQLEGQGVDVEALLASVK